MSDPLFDSGAIVRSVMDEHPETIAVFLRRRMHCPGCVMSPFMTLAEAAESYRIDPAELITELQDAISPPPCGDPA